MRQLRVASQVSLTTTKFVETTTPTAAENIILGQYSTVDQAHVRCLLCWSGVVVSSCKCNDPCPLFLIFFSPFFSFAFCFCAVKPFIFCVPNRAYSTLINVGSKSKSDCCNVAPTNTYLHTIIQLFDKACICTNARDDITQNEVLM